VNSWGLRFGVHLQHVLREKNLFTEPEHRPLEKLEPWFAFYTSLITHLRAETSREDETIPVSVE